MAAKAKREPNTTEDGQLACAFGELWTGPHYLCRAETARICGVPVEDVPLADFSRYADGVTVELGQQELFGKGES